MDTVVEKLPVIESITTVSGATVVFLDDLSVLKISQDAKVVKRLHSQAEFMDRTAQQLFPEVKALVTCGYMMERLQETDGSYWNDVNVVETVKEMKDLLTEHMWVDTLAAPLLYNGWLEKLTKAIISRMIKEGFPSILIISIIAQISRLRELKLQVCETHGDPTFSNVMESRSGVMLITDPLPWYESYMPPLKAVDLGKILQSIAGYDRIINPELFPKLTVATEDAMLDVLFKNETFDTRKASWIFCLIHYVRLLPYQKPELKPELIKILEGVLDVCETL
jgi:hypothetical protein